MCAHGRMEGNHHSFVDAGGGGWPDHQLMGSVAVAHPFPGDGLAEAGTGPGVGANPDRRKGPSVTDYRFGRRASDRGYTPRRLSRIERLAKAATTKTWMITFALITVLGLVLFIASTVSGCAGTTQATVNDAISCVDQHEDTCPKPGDLADWQGWLKFAGCLGMASLSCVDDAKLSEHEGGQFMPCDSDEVDACIGAQSCKDTMTCKALASACLDEVCR